MKHQLLSTTSAAPQAPPSEPQIIPPDFSKKTSQEQVIFHPEDVDQALKIFDANPFARRESMREVLMFALKIAAINLDVR